ncbi:MAG: hypothetical protein HY318_08230 [Armatimonadetes bacterium]|nr:hypothetical protein [Armatimonadota bacterium]
MMIDQKPDNREILFSVLRTFYRRRRTFWTVCLTMFALICAAVYIITPKYQAQATLYVALEQPTESLFPDQKPPGSGAVSSQNSTAILNSLINVLQSKGIAGDMVRQFHLDRELPPKNLRERIHQFGKDAFTGCLRVCGIKKKKDLFLDAVEDFQDDCAAEVNEGTEVIVLSVQHEDAETARDICNAMAQDFMRTVIRQGQSDFKADSASFHLQLEAAKARLMGSDSALRQFKEKQGIVDLSYEQQTAVSRLDSMLNDLRSSEASLKQNQASLDVNRQQLKSQPVRILTSKTIENNPQVLALKNVLSDQENRLAGLRVDYTDEHPDVVKLEEQIKDTQDRLHSEVSRLLTKESHDLNPEYTTLLDRVAKSESEILGMKARTAALSQGLGRFQKQIKSLAAKDQVLTHLKREQDLAESLYHILDLKARQFKVLQHVNIPPVRLRIVDQAVVPDFFSITTPPMLLVIPLTPIISVLVALCFIFMLEYFDTSLRYPAEVERLLGVPVIQSIPRLR